MLGQCEGTTDGGLVTTFRELALEHGMQASNMGKIAEFVSGDPPGQSAGGF